VRAMVLNELNTPLQWTEMPDRLPGPNEIRVKVGACGVCRTDLHVVDGDLPGPKLPIIPGHEIVGRLGVYGFGAAAHIIASSRKPHPTCCSAPMTRWPIFATAASRVPPYWRPDPKNTLSVGKLRRGAPLGLSTYNLLGRCALRDLEGFRCNSMCAPMTKSNGLGLSL